MISTIVLAWILVTRVQYGFANFIVDDIESLIFGKKNTDLKASLNEYLDSVIDGLNTKISYPINIPDYNVTVNTEILVVPLFGTFNLYNARVMQVGEVTRSRDAPVSYTDQTLSIDLALKIQNVEFIGDFTAKFESLGPSGSMEGTIAELTIEAGLKADVKTLQINVTNFYMEAGSIELSLNILPVLNWFLNSLIQLIIYIIQWPVLNMISTDIQTSLQTQLNSYLLPLQQ